MQKKVFALDLDGTPTEHRTWISDENIAALDELKDAGLRLVIVGAGHDQDNPHPPRRNKLLRFCDNY